MLGSPVLGDIQLSLCDKRGDLEIEVGQWPVESQPRLRSPILNVNC